MRILACLLILPLCGCLNSQYGKYTHDHEMHSASAQLIQKGNQYVLEVSVLRVTAKCKSSVPFSECDVELSEATFEELENPSKEKDPRSYRANNPKAIPHLSQRIDTNYHAAPTVRFDKVGPFKVFIGNKEETAGVMVKGDAKEVDGQMQVVNCSFKLMEEPGSKTRGFQNQTIVVGERKTIPVIEISNDQ